MLIQQLQDIDRWNATRPVEVNLAGAKLARSQLSRIDLSNAKLRGADLRGADLRDADLSACDLREADLRKANLSGARLPGARLSNATMGGAKFARADLAGANLSEANAKKVNFSNANLTNVSADDAQLSDSTFRRAKMTGFNASSATLRRARFLDARMPDAFLIYADLTDADLRRAVLPRASLYCARLTHADLTLADLSDSDLRNCSMNETTVTGCHLRGSAVYGVSAWNVWGVPADQRDLLLANCPPRLMRGAHEARRRELDELLAASGGERSSCLALTMSDGDHYQISVDDLEIAQFTNLLLNHEKFRKIIQTMTSKVVLILGRFSPERKVVLDAIADEVRSHGMIPMMFDFDHGSSRDFTEMVQTLAGLSLFVIADVTSPQSIPQELMSAVPHLQIPFMPIIHGDDGAYSMLADFKKYSWFSTVLRYQSTESLIKVLKVAVIDEALRMRESIRHSKAIALSERNAEDYLLAQVKVPAQSV